MVKYIKKNMVDSHGSENKLKNYNIRIVLNAPPNIIMETFDEIIEGCKAVKWSQFLKIIKHAKSCTFSDYYEGCTVYIITNNHNYKFLLDTVHDNIDLEFIQSELVKDMKQLERLEVTSPFAYEIDYHHFTYLPETVKYVYFEHLIGLKFEKFHHIESITTKMLTDKYELDNYIKRAKLCDIKLIHHE